MPSTTLMNKELTSLFIASTLNKSLKNSHDKITEYKVELGIDSFLKELHKLMQDYTVRFKQDIFTNTAIDKDKLISIINEQTFSDFIQVSKDKLIVEVIPSKYETSLSNIILSSTMGYSKLLIKNINDIGKMCIQAKETTEQPERKEVIHDEIKDDIVEETKVPIPVGTDDEKTSEKFQQSSSKTHKEVTVIEIGQGSTEPKETEDNHKAQTKDVDKELKVEPQGSSDEQSNELSNGSREANKEPELKEEIKEEPELKETKEEPTESHMNTKSPTPEPKESRKRSLSPSVASTQHKRFQHIAVNLINSIQAHRFSSPFLQAVNRKEAPDYYDLIYEPKDLKNILKSIKSKNDPPEYSSIKQLERDIMLMFANCIMYNQSNDSLVELTLSMKNDVKSLFKLFEEAESDIK